MFSRRTRFAPYAWGWILDYLWCLPICLPSSLCRTWGTYSFIIILFYHFNIITIINLGRSIRIYIFSGGTRRGLVLSTVPMCKMWKTRRRLKHFWSNYSPMQCLRKCEYFLYISGSVNCLMYIRTVTRKTNLYHDSFFYICAYCI